MERQLVVNRAKCLRCGGVLVSKHRHNFISCKCGNVSIDGSTSCPRRIVSDMEYYLDCSLYTDSDFKEIRKYVYRGSYGADGKQPLEWIRLCDMSDEHLKNAIKYKIEQREINDVHMWAYCREVEYRGQTTSN